MTRAMLTLPIYHQFGTQITSVEDRERARRGRSTQFFSIIHFSNRGWRGLDYHELEIVSHRPRKALARTKYRLHLRLVSSGWQSVKTMPLRGEQLNAFLLEE